jgi:hypothetical protein
MNYVCFLLGDYSTSVVIMPTDRVFRNVGIYISDAEKSPRSKPTTMIVFLIAFSYILLVICDPTVHTDCTFYNNNNNNNNNIY